jgi:hypothetical protein
MTLNGGGTCPGLPDAILHTKVPIWEYFGGQWNVKCWYSYVVDIWYILRQFGAFYSSLVCILYSNLCVAVIWYILRQFGAFYSSLVCILYSSLCVAVIWYISSLLVCCAKKNLATLVSCRLQLGGKQKINRH